MKIEKRSALVVAGVVVVAVLFLALGKVAEGQEAILLEVRSDSETLTVRGTRDNPQFFIKPNIGPEVRITDPARITRLRAEFERRLASVEHSAAIATLEGVLADLKTKPSTDPALLRIEQAIIALIERG
jgi:hypothetical protein